MSTTETIKELKTLFLSYHSLLIYETNEEERVEEFVSKAGNDLGIVVYRWTNTKGFIEEPANPLSQTIDIADAIRFMSMNSRRSIFLLRASSEI
jgi:hypothetical protein